MTKSTMETKSHDAESWIGLSGLVDGELPDADRVLRELDRPYALDALRHLVRTRALFAANEESSFLSPAESAALWDGIRVEERRHRRRRIWPVAALLAMVLGLGIFLGVLLPDAAAPPPTPNPAVLAEWRSDHLPPRPDRVLRLGPEDRFFPAHPQETNR